jgi:anhydro-N-acetylmuramic acid kinase
MGHQFANAALLLVKKLKSQAIDVDLISSHGQTLYHRPPEGGSNGYTLQIGDPSVIAERTEIEVVADFRPGDMAAGGHGAPLVPFADLLMFQEPERPIAIQNIGGIANVTALPPSNSLQDKPLAFDTGPGNMIIDTLMQTLFQQPMDKNGDTARKGKVHQELLDHLMRHPYLSAPPPKSTGREMFGTGFAQQIAAEWGRKMSKEDLIHTATMFTVQSIVQGYEQFVLPQLRVREVILGGGGTLNQFMVEKLAEAFRPHFISLRTHEDFGVSSKYKEAIAFAMLGYARKMGIPNNLPSCTGANRPVSLGAIWYP